MISAILAGLSGAFTKAWDFASRYPFQALCVILAGLLVWQTVGKNNALHKLDAERTAHKADIVEWQRKSDAAKAATQKAENDAKEAANNAQDVRDKLAAESDRLEQFIAARRVPAQCPGTVSGTSKGDTPRVPEATTSEALVAVEPADLRTCDALYVYSAASYAWGRELVSKGLAVDK